MAKKLIISQVRKYLKKQSEAKNTDTESYLDFMNTGIYVDLNRYKRVAFGLVDRILSRLEGGSKQQ